MSSGDFQMARLSKLFFESSKYKWYLTIILTANRYTTVYMYVGV